ncbi:hypothetical protein ACO0LF_16910 [Undibacterium sp. Di27W]|uniref:hypothetical protein n=1 Tax=Undibacterium sp. Di27W TaxID=3413036 RepID=UPI003BF07D30
MSKKNELTLLLAKVLLKFSSDSQLAWDQSYCRYLAEDQVAPSFQFMSRLGKILSARAAQAEYTDLLGPLMQSLFDEMLAETSRRPVLAVLTVDAAKTYKLKLEYQNPQAHDISLLALGTPASYFAADEIEIPAQVLEQQKEMANLLHNIASKKP